MEFFFTVTAASFTGFLLGATAVEIYLKVQEHRARKKYDAFFASLEPGKSPVSEPPEEPATSAQN